MFRFVNEPVPSNTYLLVSRERNECVVIDPGSKNPRDIINFICNQDLSLRFIILTHEHFDHCWGASCLQEKFCSNVVGTRKCAEWLSIPMNYFNKLYYNSEETYSVRVDILVEDVNWKLEWENCKLSFCSANGHTDKGMYIVVGNNIFSGDTLLLNTKPFIKKRYGGDIFILYHTIKSIFDNYSENTFVYPGHGTSFILKDARPFYNDFFKKTINNEL